MNKFELICYYCNYSWEVNYTPSDIIYCQRCRDSNIRVIDKATEKVDYYIGCLPFSEEFKGNRQNEREDRPYRDKYDI